MAKKDRKKTSKIKTKKKVWYPVLAPALYSQKEVGETYLVDAEAAIGRVFAINARDLTGNIRDQNSYVKFAVSGFNGHALTTEVIGFSVNSATVKRAVRKNTARLDDYFLLPKDGKVIVIKTTLVTRNRVQRSTKTDLRQKLRQLVAQDAKKNAFSTFVGLVVDNKVQINAKRRLNKVCPIKEVLVRSLELKNPSRKRVVTPIEEPLVEEPQEE